MISAQAAGEALRVLIIAERMTLVAMTARIAVGGNGNYLDVSFRRNKFRGPIRWKPPLTCAP